MKKSRSIGITHLCAVAVFCVAIFSAYDVFADTSAKTAGTAISDDSNGAPVSGVWGYDGTLNFVLSASDNDYATNEALDFSDYLRGTNFGFTIPTGSTIDGIQLSVERKADAAGGGGGGERWEDSVVRLVVGGSIVGDNKAIVGSWSTTEGVVTYGGAADLWGLTPTVSQINASDFGFVLSAIENRGDGTNTASVDQVTMTVTYTPPASTGAPKSIIIVKKFPNDINYKYF